MTATAPQAVERRDVAEPRGAWRGRGRDSLRVCHSGHLSIVAGARLAGRGDRELRHGRELAGLIVPARSKGIGRAIATSFAEGGAAVMLSSRKQEGLDEAADAIAAVSAGRAGRDVRRECRRSRPGRRVRRRRPSSASGALDMLVNNAATNPSDGRDDRRRAPDVGQDVPGERSGHVRVDPARMAGVDARPRRIGRSTSPRSAASGATPPSASTTPRKPRSSTSPRSWRSSSGPAVRVNCIAPGWSRPTSPAACGSPPATRRRRPPLRRLGEPGGHRPRGALPRRTGRAWITGHTLVVDGGAIAGASPISSSDDATPAGRLNSHAALRQLRRPESLLHRRR